MKTQRRAGEDQFDQKGYRPGLVASASNCLGQGDLSVSGMRERSKALKPSHLLSLGLQVLSWPKHEQGLRKDLHGCEGS